MDLIYLNWSEVVGFVVIDNNSIAFIYLIQMIYKNDFNYNDCVFS